MFAYFSYYWVILNLDPICKYCLLNVHNASSHPSLGLWTCSSSLTPSSHPWLRHITCSWWHRALKLAEWTGERSSRAVPRSIPGGEYILEKGKAKIGTGVMASKEPQVIKDLALQNNKKDEGKKASQQCEEESHHLDTWTRLKTRNLGEMSEGDESGDLCLIFYGPCQIDMLITMKGERMLENL